MDNSEYLKLDIDFNEIKSHRDMVLGFRDSQVPRGMTWV